MTQTPITRRQVLAGLGAVGLVAAGPRLVRAARGEPAFTRYTLAQSTTGGPDLRIAWYETYNGDYQEDSGRFTGGPGLQPTNSSFDAAAEAGRFVDTTADAEGEAVGAGAVVDLGNVMPGDEGAVVVGLLADAADATVWFRLRLDATPENGLVEPERTAGDATDAVGELQDAVRVALWYDDSTLGGCNGETDGSEGFVTSLSSLGDLDGTLADVADATESDEPADEGVRLDFDLLGSGCLPANTQRCVGFRWAVPASVANEVQTDGVSFALEFATVPCGEATNPFTGASTEAGR
ncbi:MAG: hypothetical protein V5A31_10195 [Haloferacaceae archaeon]|jgi:hypothetical protein